MDDKEYYSLMNKMPSSALLTELKKKAEKAKNNKKITNSTQNSQIFTQLEGRQGREDAEMLIFEKQDSTEE